MFMQQGLLELDIHGMNKHQAKVFIDSRLRRADTSVYRVRIIHGYRGGTELRDMVRLEYQGPPQSFTGIAFAESWRDGAGAARILMVCCFK